MPGRKRAASPPKQAAKKAKPAPKAPAKKAAAPKKSPPPKKAAAKKSDIVQTAKTLSALGGAAPPKKGDKPVPKAPKCPLMKGAIVEASKGVDEYQGNDTAGCWNITSFNVNGLRAIIKNNNQIVELAKKEKPHLICLQETKIDEEEALKIGNFVPGYQVVWNCCRVKKGYSGTATLVRDDVVPEFNVTTDGLGGDHNEEGRYQLIEGKDFYLINTYVPNAGQKLERLDYRVDEWDVAMRELLAKLVSEGKKGVVWTGDLNVAHTEIDLANPTTNHKSAGFTPQERNSFTETLEVGFTDTFRHFHQGSKDFFSYWGYRQNCRERNMGWRLDYFVVNDDFLPTVQASSILSAYYGSDHCPIQLLVKQ